MTKIKLMQKLALALVTFLVFFLVNTGSVFAVAPGDNCTVGATTACGGPESGFGCQVTDAAKDPKIGTCQPKIDVGTPQKGFATIGNAVSNFLIIVFSIAVLVVLVMLVLGAFEWITSGGDKEAVGKARGRIINALIGLAVLAVAFALARVAGQFTGLDLNNITIPAPNPKASGL